MFFDNKKVGGGGVDSSFRTNESTQNANNKGANAQTVGATQSNIDFVDSATQLYKNSKLNTTQLSNRNAKNYTRVCVNNKQSRIDKAKNAISCGGVSSAKSTKSQLLNIGDAENARLQNVATLQKHTNKKINKKEKYAQTTLTRLAGDKCIGKGAMYMNLKNRVTNKINSKALSTYKETVQHKHATLSILMWLLAVCIGLTMLIMLPTTNYKANTMAIGTAENPDLTVDSVADLLALSTQTGEFAGSWGTSNSDAKYIKLTTDLTLTADDLPKLASDSTKYTWNPIGTNSSERFWGTFDGNGYTITFAVPITIEAPYAGLFGYAVGDSAIKNLGVNWQGGLIGSGARCVGGIVGTSLVTITNCYNTGAVTGAEGIEYVGGIVGSASRTITNCYNTGAVNCTEDAAYAAGGIAGNASCDIINCYNTGAVTGAPSVGGVAGSVYGDVTFCYNTGAVNGIEFAIFAGGIAGDVSGEVTNCYNDGTISGWSDGTGGIVGYLSGPIITNCYNKGEIIGLSSYVGGLMGSADATTISRCYNMGAISVIGGGEYTPYMVGGIIGNAIYEVYIDNCYNVGDFYVKENIDVMYIGGIAGYLSSDSLISNSYNVATINFTDSSSVDCLGGIAGSNNNTIVDCFNIMELNTVSGSNLGMVGGIIAEGSSESIANCYYNVEPSSVLDNDYGDQIESSSLSGESSLSYFQSTTNWSSTNAWSIDAKATSNSTATWTIVDGINNGYPILRAFYEYYDITGGKPATLTGSGSQTDPYKINTAQDLKYFANTQSMWGTSGTPVYVELMNDIEYKDSWSPIGTDSTNAFYGIFEGNNHEITITNEITLKTQYGGLFGYIGAGSTIQNLGVNWQAGLVCINETGTCLGGIVGTGGSLKNCYTNGYITLSGVESMISTFAIGGIVNSRTRVGGIAGSGVVDGCYNFASVSVQSVGDNEYVGGIIGYASATVSNCYNMGAIDVTDGYIPSVGGIAGGIPNEGGEFINCYNMGSVYAISNNNFAHAGGIVGYALSMQCKIVNCFSIIQSSDAVYAATLNGPSDIGGIVGITTPTDNILNCFYNISPTNANNNYGTLVADSNGESLLSAMQDKESFTSENGSFSVGGSTYSWNTTAEYAWNFTQTWGINPKYNGGLPALRAFYGASITYQYAENDTTTITPIIDNVNLLDDPTFGASTTITRPNYTFTQWTDGENFYDVGSPITVTGDITLWPADWVASTIDFEISFSQSASSSTPNNVFVYLVVNDSIVQQGFLSSTLQLSSQVFATDSVTIIVTGGYMTNITLTGDGGEQVGNKFVLDLSNLPDNNIVAITYIVTAPDINTGFNNSIII